MILETFTPTERLRPFIKCYMIVDCDETVVNSMLPNTALVLGFRFKGTTKYLTDTENKLPFAVVAGLRRSIQLMKDEADTGNLLVIFEIAGATKFFREPLHYMFDEVQSLTEFSNYRTLSEVEDKLKGARSNRERIKIVDDFLRSKIFDCKHDQLVTRATEIIRSHNGFIRIKNLTDTLAIIIDAFEKRFRRSTGASPKQFSHIVRMNAIIGSITQKTLAQTALDAGYYDQAHFTKDFKIFKGQTPTEFLHSPTP